MKPKKSFQLFAVTTPGLENITARELEEIDITPVRPIHGGVEFEGGLQSLYRANLWLRTASRVLVRVGQFKCRDFPALYQKTLRLPWGRFIRPGTRLRVKATSLSSRLVHTDRISETIEAAIHHGLGSIDSRLDTPQQIIIARFEEDFCHLSVDSSGELLHRRGYRGKAVSAPLRETLAAGTLILLGWRGDIPLIDPMCGSGTFPVEAALLATTRAPGARRPFAFMHWPHFREGLWEALKTSAQKKIRPLPVSIYASDKDPLAVEAACRNAAAAGVRDLIEIREKDLTQLRPPENRGLIVCNPPYGKRLQSQDNLDLYRRELGQSLRQNLSGWALALTCPPSLAKATRLDWEKIAGFNNGGIKIHLYRTLL